MNHILSRVRVTVISAQYKPNPLKRFISGCPDCKALKQASGQVNYKIKSKEELDTTNTKIPPKLAKIPRYPEELQVKIH